MSELSGSASDAVCHLLSGRHRRADVVGAGPRAAYLVVEGEVVAVVSTDAVRLPCAVVLAPGTTVPAGLAPGARVCVGEGAIGWQGPDNSAGRVRVVRWWSAPRVQAGVFGEHPSAVLRGRLHGHRLPTGVPTHLHAAAVLVGRGDTHAAVAEVAAVLGRGAGLTPSADDAVAGLLLASRVVAGPVVLRALDEMAVRIDAIAAQRTTAVSAALLAHAARGRAAPQVVAAVEALTGRRPVEPALDALWALGHSSGADTAAGLAVAVSVATSRERAA